MIFKYLRRKLGIDDLYDQYHGVRGAVGRNTATLETLHAQVVVLSGQVTALMPHIARAVAAVDPLYGTPEDNPERRIASDKLGDEVMKKMLGEHAERSKYK